MPFAVDDVAIVTVESAYATGDVGVVFVTLEAVHVADVVNVVDSVDETGCWRQNEALSRFTPLTERLKQLKKLML